MYIEKKICSLSRCETLRRKHSRGKIACRTTLRRKIFSWIHTQLKFHRNNVKIYQSGKFMFFQYIDHSHLGITFSFFAILITTLT